MDADS